MKFEKKGLIFSPDKKYWWREKYAMMPTPIHLKEKGIIRIYYGTTDKDNFGRTSYLDVDDRDPGKVVYMNDEVVLDLGVEGTFDDCGAVPSCVLEDGDHLKMYYVGFQRCYKVPYMLFSGLAVGSGLEGRSFSRYSLAPIIDRSKANCFSNAAPFVIKDDGRYKMWFWKGERWLQNKGKAYLNAVIGYAESSDGMNWVMITDRCIVPEHPVEFSVGRPWIFKDSGRYRMFYSVRHVDRLYRLGYAESEDGINWVRMDGLVDLDVSSEGWDSEMVCYPALLRVGEKAYLFYNGNNNGETGFGYAEVTGL